MDDIKNIEIQLGVEITRTEKDLGLETGGLRRIRGHVVGLLTMIDSQRVEIETLKARIELLVNCDAER